MSVLQINKYSIALSRLITFHVILPDDAIPMMIEGNKNYERKPKTLYLLHGFSGNTTDWLYGSRIQELAMQYNLAVVLPSGENSFYLNGKGTGRAYETFCRSGTARLLYKRHLVFQINRKTISLEPFYGRIWGDSYSFEIS